MIRAVVPLDQVPLLRWHEFTSSILSKNPIRNERLTKEFNTCFRSRPPLRPEVSKDGPELHAWTVAFHESFSRRTPLNFFALPHDHKLTGGLVALGLRDCASL
jgi:hypothetical protein